jgi:hypothetical protein
MACSRGTTVSAQDSLELSRPTGPPQNLANNSPRGLRRQGDGFILSSVGNQGIYVIESDQSRYDQSLLSVPSHNNLAHQFVTMHLQGINRDDVVIEDQRRHRIAFYSQADRGLRIGAPVHGRCQHRLRPHLLQIDILVAQFTRSSSMDRKERNSDEISNWMTSFTAMCTNHTQIRKSIFMQALTCCGKYSHHVGCA